MKGTIESHIQTGKTQCQSSQQPGEYFKLFNPSNKCQISTCKSSAGSFASVRGSLQRKVNVGAFLPLELLITSSLIII